MPYQRHHLTTFLEHALDKDPELGTPALYSLIQIENDQSSVSAWVEAED